MSRLTNSARQALPANVFAGPNRSYPIPNASHARDALAMAARFASPGERQHIDAEVHQHFPQIDQGGKPGQDKMRGRHAIAAELSRKPF